MASPLRAFRKYQKQMLVFFGVLLMIAFVLGGVLTSMPNSGPGGREPQDSISVRWDGASYSQDELENFLRLHLMSQRFLAVLAQTAQQNGALPRTDPSLLPVSNDQEGGIRDAANILLQADEANRLGVQITEKVVDDYLSRVCDRSFNENEYMQILKESTGGQLSLARLRQHLKTELAALRLQDIIFSGMGGPGGQMTQFGPMSAPPQPFVTPTSAVVSQERMINTAKIEFIPVEVEPFLDEITDTPSNSDIRKLYERGAVQFPGFQKKTPGFRVPDQAAIQWFKTDQDSFLPPADSITEELIQDEYNRRVEAKDLSVIDQTPAEEPAPMDTEGETPEGDTTEENGSEGDNSEGQSEEGSGETTPPAEESKPEDAPAEETDKNEEEGSTEESGTEEEGDGQSSLSTKTGTQFVSAPVTQEDAQEETEASEASQEDDAAEAPTQESAEPTDQEGEASETQAPETTDETPNAEGETTPEPQEPETKFKSLEDVREDIIEDLRRQEAGEKRNKAIENLIEVMNNYWDEYEIWDAESYDNPDAPAPPAPNFEELASEYGITFGQTEGFVDFAEFTETELGQSFSEIPRSQFNFQNFPTVAQTLFQSFREGKQYQPKTTLLRDYIYWISEKEPQHVPTLDEARDDIIRFWKWNQAVEMAQAEAQAKLGKGDSLVAEFPDEAFESQPFSWLSIGGGNVAQGGGQLSLSSVNYQDGDELKSLDTVGNDFMRAVFSLEVGDGTAAVDAPRETVFAVKLLDLVSEDTAAESKVKNQMAPSQEDQRVIGTSMGEYRDDWVADLLKRRNVRWTVKKVN